MTGVKGALIGAALSCGRSGHEVRCCLLSSHFPHHWELDAFDLAHALKEDSEVPLRRLYVSKHGGKKNVVVKKEQQEGGV